MEWVSDALPALEGAAQEAPREACASLKDGVQDKGEAPLEIAAELSFLARLANAHSHRLKGPSRLVLNSPIIPMKWDQPSSACLSKVSILPNRSSTVGALSTRGIFCRSHAQPLPYQPSHTGGGTFKRVLRPLPQLFGQKFLHACGQGRNAHAQP